MNDFVDLGGTTPPDESCAQVGSREYDCHDRARKERNVKRRSLSRRLPEFELSRFWRS